MKIKNKLTPPQDDFHYWINNSTPKEFIEYIDSFFPEEERFSSLILNDEKKSNKPLIIENYTLPTFNIPMSSGKGFDGSLRKQLSKILTFIKFTQKRRYKDGCTAINIPTTSAENEWIWGSRANISNAIKLMIKIGLIEIYDSSYRFNAFREDENKSRMFKYYVDNERKLLEYCEQNNIVFYSPDDEVDLEPTQKEIEYYNKIVGLPDPKTVRFNSKIELVKPNDISKTKFERYLRICLYQNYPLFIETYKNVREMNKKFYKDYPEFLIRFWPSFTWGKKTKRDDKSNTVVGIGIRATNSFCNKDKEERKEIIKNYGFDREKDIKSSVPRLTLGLNKDVEWVFNDIDIYELISKEMDPQIPFTTDRREAIKFLHMRAYFDESSKDLVGRNVWIKMTTNGLNKDDIYKEMDKLKKAVLKVKGGKTYGNEIFYVESVVCLRTLRYLLQEKNQLVWLVYDCFYGKGYDTQEFFELMIKAAVLAFFMEFKEKWVKMGC